MKYFSFDFVLQFTYTHSSVMICSFSQIYIETNCGYYLNIIKICNENIESHQKGCIVWRHITANIHVPPCVDIEVIFNFEHADQSSYFVIEHKMKIEH